MTHVCQGLSRKKTIAKIEWHWFCCSFCKIKLVAVRYQYIFYINIQYPRPWDFKVTSSYSNFRYIGTRWIIFLSNFGDQSLIITDDPSVGIKNIFVLALLDSAADRWIVWGRLCQTWATFLPLGAQQVGTFERVDLQVEGTPGGDT